MLRVSCISAARWRALCIIPLPGGMIPLLVGVLYHMPNFLLQYFSCLLIRKPIQRGSS